MSAKLGQDDIARSRDEAIRLGSLLQTHGELTPRRLVEALCAAVFRAQTLGTGPDRLHMLSERLGFIEVQVSVQGGPGFPNLTIEGDPGTDFDHFIAVRLKQDYSLWACIVAPAKAISASPDAKRGADGVTTMSWMDYRNLTEAKNATCELAEVLGSRQETGWAA